MIQALVAVGMLLIASFSIIGMLMVWMMDDYLYEEDCDACKED